MTDFNESLNNLPESQFEIIVALVDKRMRDEGIGFNIEKPCRVCGFCPYGTLVEDMPIYENKRASSCGVFGHECPAFVYSEPFVDIDEEEEEE